MKSRNCDPINTLQCCAKFPYLQPIAWLWYNSPTMPNMPNDMPNSLELLASTVHRRQLTTPLLLLLASHRPLTFVSGQLLYTLAPLGSLLGWESVSQWAALLSAPDANQRLTLMLTAPRAGAITHPANDEI
jgi:hypothetical protein